MKYFLLALGICLASFAYAQSIPPAKIVMKNNDVLTGKILEIIPETSVKILVYGSSELTVPYNQIAYILFNDAQPGFSNNPSISAGENHRTKDPIYKKFYFMSVNEAVAGLGVGYIGGLTVPTEPASPNPFVPVIYKKVLNRTSYGGLYSANGIGYKGWAFVGLGIGALRISENYGTQIPFALDLRARIFPSKKISPLIMSNVGISYHTGSVGSFDFTDGLGISFEHSSKLHIHGLLTHSYTKYDKQLSASGAASSIGNYYFNYIGFRLGASFVIQ